MYSRTGFEVLNREIVTEEEVIFFPLVEWENWTKAKSHDYFMLLLFESGSGTHRIDFKDFELGAKQFHLLQPQHTHEFKFNKDVKGYGLRVHRSIFELFSIGFHFALPMFIKHPVLKMNLLEFEYLQKEFEGIAEEIHSKKFKDLIIARLFVIAFLVSRISKAYFRELTQVNENPKVYTFLKLIDLFYQSNRAVSFYAEKLNITTSHLTILCQRYFGSTATNLIDARILLEAKKLLASGISVKETAYTLNFRDVSYFSRYFKVRTKITPREFIAECRID